MSVYIKGMEMPVDCLACRISCKHESYRGPGRPFDCPLEDAGGMISREGAIDAICKVWCYTTYGMCPHDDGYCKGCDEIEAIDALPSADAVSREEYDQLEALYDAIRIYDSSAEAVQGWILCSERLPDVDVEVLATVDWSDVRIAWLKKDGTWETDEYILANDEILAWMPLPKPYREDGEV